MRIRGSIRWIAAFVAVFVAWALWFRRNQPAETQLSASPNIAGKPIAAASQMPLINAKPRTNASAANVARKSSTPNPTMGSKIERMQGILATYNDVPIDFYGKLEDQFGNPVTSAEIKGSIRVINGQRETTDHPSTISDANGLFEFHGKGQDIGMMPHKFGYAIVSTDTLFKYSRMEDNPFTSDANNPTVIKMWKLQGAEPLLRINQNYKLQYSDQPITFDIVSGSVVSSGGDLNISVNRPAGIISPRHPQGWSIDINVPGGGLIGTSPSEARTTYAAPDTGYQSSEVLGNNNGPTLVDYTFFLKSRGGALYSKIHLLFGINDTDVGFMYVTISGVANTNGSRNWEGDASGMATVAQ